MDRVVILVHGGGQFTPGWSKSSVDKLAHILGWQPETAEVTYSHFFPHATALSASLALLKVLTLILWRALRFAFSQGRASGSRSLRDPLSSDTLRSLVPDTQRAHRLETPVARQVVDDLWQEVGRNLERSGISAVDFLTRDASKNVSLFQLALDVVGQVASYVCEPNKPGQGDEAQHALREALNRYGKEREVVLVSHSLGTVVAFDVLCEHASEYNICTWFTLGCPLSLLVSREFRRANCGQIGPPGVRRWINVFDPGDPVTNAFLLSSKLGATFPFVEDTEADLALSLPSAHDYLNSWKVMEEVAKALAKG